jgi:hypothetical protein
VQDGPGTQLGLPPTEGTQLLKLAAALLIAMAAAHAADTQGRFVQAVEFPYYLYPHALWDRELVWLKNIGVQTVAFNIPRDYHQVAAGDYDIAGRTSPRRDLVGFIKTLRKLGLRAWIRGAAENDAEWNRLLKQTLTTQTVSHGGPVEFVESRAMGIDASAPPAPITTVSAIDPAALARSREALTHGGALVWTNVEDALYPAGWPGVTGSLLRKGAVGLSGDEHSSTAALRRTAALLRGWSAMLPQMRHVAMPKPTAGKLPSGVTATELTSAAATAVSITNSGTQPFQDELRVFDPMTKKALAIPAVTVPAGQSMWLPVGVSLGPKSLCRDCTNFAATEHIVYATAELLSIEYENGILAMEFAAPEPGEVVLQLARAPVGPFLAAGKLTEFDWDEPHMRARLKIPASKQPDLRVRIGIAIEAPDTSAFFNELHRLVIGRKNTISTIYSSADVAGRSRLRLPEGYTATPVTKSPNEIDYEVAVPADALHGDYASLALEADGVALGRARVQLFRPVSVRLLSGMQFHIGPDTEITPDPPVTPIEPRAGSNIEFALRNNSTQIQNYHLELSGDGLDFFPPKVDLAVGATDERRAEFRVFAHEGITGLRDFTLKISGGAEITMPMRAILVPRNQTVAWSADLDGDGVPEWVLESPRVRAVFSLQDGGRWMDLVWKDSNTDFLPESGLLWGGGPAEVRPTEGGSLEFTTQGGKRTVSLVGSAVTVEQTSPIPAEILPPGKKGNITLGVERPSPTKMVVRLDQ